MPAPHPAALPTTPASCLPRACPRSAAAAPACPCLTAPGPCPFARPPHRARTRAFGAPCLVCLASPPSPAPLPSLSFPSSLPPSPFLSLPVSLSPPLPLSCPVPCLRAFADAQVHGRRPSQCTSAAGGFLVAAMPVASCLLPLCRYASPPPLAPALPSTRTSRNPPQLLPRARSRGSLASGAMGRVWPAAGRRQMRDVCVLGT